MPRVFVNEREILPPCDISSLDQILKHVEAAHLPPNSVVRQIHVDGLPLRADTLFNDFSEPLKQMEYREKIEFFTGTLTEIACESIGEAIVYLDRVEKIGPSLAEDLQVAAGPQAFEKLRELYEGFYWLTLLLDKLNHSFHINLDDIFIQEVSAREHHRKFVSVLKQLVQSQEKNDLVLVSDLLEFEVLPLIAVWKEMFQIILDRVRVPQ